MLEPIKERWPQHIADWHKQKLQIITVNQRSIKDILCNVNHHWKHGTCTCKCNQVYDKLRAKGYMDKLPEINGHIFMIGRDYSGPYNAVLQTNNTDIPHPTHSDAQRAWEYAYTTLPSAFQDLVSKDAWTQTRDQVVARMYTYPRTEKTYTPTLKTVQVYTLRKLMDGLIIGPIDKNNGECSLVCPTLYLEAVKKAYPLDGVDFDHIQPKRLTTYQVKKRPGVDILELVSNVNHRLPTKQRGDEADIIATWKTHYHRMQWQSVAPFNDNGKIGIPYVLFKAKNITDRTLRATKWNKARPIAPTFAHPMYKLLHYVGRALYFMVNHLQGEHFIIADTNKVPQFFQHAMTKLQGQPIQATVLDIEGCYPNMPKEVIRHSMMDIVQRLQTQGRTGVYVPTRATTHKCSWTGKSHG